MPNEAPWSLQTFQNSSQWLKALICVLWGKQYRDLGTQRAKLRVPMQNKKGTILHKDKNMGFSKWILTCSTQMDKNPAADLGLELAGAGIRLCHCLVTKHGRSSDCAIAQVSSCQEITKNALYNVIKGHCIYLHGLAKVVFHYSFSLFLLHLLSSKS